VGFPLVQIYAMTNANCDTGPLMTAFPSKIPAAEIVCAPIHPSARRLSRNLLACLSQDVQQTLINLGVPVANDPVSHVALREELTATHYLVAQR
jgi:hypothetical protein